MKLCSSILQEISNIVVSDIVYLPKTKFFQNDETQAGVVSYPPSKTLACNNHDAINTEQAADELAFASTVRADERELANKPHCFRYVGLYQYVSVVQLEERCTCNALVVGANPIGYFPAGLDLHLFLSDNGAGNYFYTNPHSPCADYNYER